MTILIKYHSCEGWVSQTTQVQVIINLFPNVLVNDNNIDITDNDNGNDNYNFTDDDDDNDDSHNDDDDDNTDNDKTSDRGLVMKSMQILHVLAQLPFLDQVLSVGIVQCHDIDLLGVLFVRVTRRSECPGCGTGSSQFCATWKMHIGLLPDTWNSGLRMRRECRERFPRVTDYKGKHQLAIPACITAFASRTWRDTCRNR